MCGFAVFLSSSDALEPRYRQADPWRQLLSHRGPDAQRSYREETVAMHFARLAIIDLSETGMQPMHSRCGRYVMAFNGEIANFRELAETHALSLRGHSDSEVLLELYRLRGEEAFPLLRGMFAAVIYDRQERSAVAVRDPFGIKPLYYAQQGTTLLLASEMKPLLVALGGSPVDETQVIRFLSRGEVDDGEETFYTRIRQLPPGHRLSWKEGSLRVAPYRSDSLDPRPVGEETREQESYYRKLLGVVRENLCADVPVGVGLSGGFDSSLLAHLVRANGVPGKTLLFTRGYRDYEGNELEAARAVGRQFSFEVQPVLLGPEEVPSLLSSVSRQQEHPITSISVLAYHKLYETARERGIKVLLEGHGGDELWAGYASYAQPADSGRSHDGSSFRRNEEILKVRPIASEKSSGSSLIQRQWNDLMGSKLQRSLRFVDRASMSAGVEVRVPYLDTEAAFSALTLPDSWKIRDGQLRSFVRRMAEPHLGREWAARPKIPIQDPQRKWLQKELREFVQDRLASRGLWIESWVDVPRLRLGYEQFLSNPAAFDNLTFLMFPLFLEEWAQAAPQEIGVS